MTALYTYQYEVKYGYGASTNRTWSMFSDRDDVNQIAWTRVTPLTMFTRGFSDNPFNNLDIFASMVAACLDKNYNVNEASFTRRNRDTGDAVDTTKTISTPGSTYWEGQQDNTDHKYGLPGQFIRFKTSTVVASNGSVRLFACRAQTYTEGVIIPAVLPTTAQAALGDWTQQQALSYLLQRMADFSAVRSRTVKTTPPSYVPGSLDTTLMYHGRSGRVGHKYGY